MIALIEDHRASYAVEPICKVLPIVPSTFHAHIARRTDPAKLSTKGQPERSCASLGSRIAKRQHPHVSIRYTERLAEAGIEPSVGSVGGSDDNALAETINGLCKAKVIHRRGPWRSFEAVEFATLE